MMKKYFTKSRPLFTDGWNSFWHFIFGLLSVYCIFIMPIFVIYQLLDTTDKNMFVDLIEFFIGFAISITICYIFFNYN
jgi:hypothetical protein